MRTLRAAACLSAAALLTLALGASAVAKTPERIIQGLPASLGEYPAQGFLLFDSDPATPGDQLAQCGGTLVGSRQFLTAAHCAVDSTQTPLPPSHFNVFLGENNTNNFSAANVHFVASNDVNLDYDAPSHRNDVAMLTLTTPVSFAPMPVAEDPDDLSSWAPGTTATIIGWGTTEGGSTSDLLLEATVPMVTDQACAQGYSNAPAGQNDFDAQTMVCAGDFVHDTCQGDSGGPLLVPAGTGFLLAGVTSWGIGCADAPFHGVYTRIGQGALNDWVLNRTPLARFSVSGSPQPGQPVTLTSTSSHPSGPTYFTAFNWDFDNDGQFDDGSGASIQRAFPAGTAVVGLEALKPGGDRATRYAQFNVAGPPAPPPPPPPPPPAAPAAVVIASPLARIVVATGALVDRRGRFGIRINFADNAPAGKKATVTVLKSGKKLGSAQVPVAAGKSVRVKVKLTKSGLRRLRKAKKLKVTLRLVLGTTVQTKTVLLRLKR